jgi:hypothetical protein
MIGLKINQAKSYFRPTPILSASDRAVRRQLMRFGAYVRRRARSSIRKRKRISRPGEPPSSHTGLLRKHIYFLYDPATQNVIIGPARLNQTIGNAPEALEVGGVSRIRRGSRRKPRTDRVRIQARPYMRPAFQAELPGLPKRFRNSIKARL